MTAKFHFRSALESDYESICALVPSESELYLVYPRGTHPLDAAQLRHLASTRKELTVALYDGVVVAFANLYDFAGNERAFVGNVVVARGMRGQGLGAKLIDHMTTIAFNNYSLREVHISVFSDNVPALLLYTRLGFVPYSIEERKNFESKRVALVHMRKLKHEH